MAARWGTGEEMLTACNMEFFSIISLDEVDVLQGDLSSDGVEARGADSGHGLAALHACLDPSILSMFEDSPTGEVKSGIDEESEATLLTALTEILDNVDNENLSPFDTLPDSELFSGQKGQELSPLRKLLCLSRSPAEKESICNPRQFPSSTGKSLPRAQSATLQRSDGEEEEDGEPGFPVLISDVDCASLDGIDWGSVPLSLEQGGDCVSVTLSDLVKHMHPYCMAVCLEEGDAQMLSEGGIVLEVVDQGEHGEPILAIPELNFPLFLPGADSQECEQRVPEKSPEKTEDVEVVGHSDSSPVKEDRGEKVIIKRPKEETSEKCPSRRKKKRKSKEAPPVKGRVLRSTSAGNAVEEPPKKPREERKKKKTRVKFAPVSSADPEKPEHSHTQKLEVPPGSQLEDSSPVAPAPPAEPSVKVSEAKPLPITESKSLLVTESKPVPIIDSKPVELPAEKSLEPDVASVPVVEDAPVSQPSEPRPKPLSLQQYRLLRQQKKPAPVEKTEDNSTKWPMLPEVPKELLPIPCLPDPNPRDPRGAGGSSAKKEVPPVVKPAWHPRGPAAPPTPEALLVPPASMTAASSKAASPKPVGPPTHPSKYVQNSSPVPSPQSPTLLSPQKRPAPVSASQNTINSNASQHAPEAPREMPADKAVSLQSTATTAAAEKILINTAVQHSKQSPAAGPISQENLPPVPSEVQEPRTLSDVSPRTTTTVQTSVAAPQQADAALLLQGVAETVTTVSEPAKCTLPADAKPPAAASRPRAAPLAARPLTPGQGLAVKTTKPVEQMKNAPAKGKKNPTEELIQSFTSEIGIEAADLASLLEQFEETQAKVEQRVPEACARAAAVGNSSVEQSAEGKVVERAQGHDLGSAAAEGKVAERAQGHDLGSTAAERKVVERAQVHDLGSTAGLTPPATPPHQMWKPLAPVALLGKNKMSEGPKLTPTKVIQIDARPLPSNKVRSKPQAPATPVHMQAFASDHDYCLPHKEPSASDLGKRWNVRQPGITIKAIELPSRNKAPQHGVFRSSANPTTATVSKKNVIQPLDDRTQCASRALTSSVMVTPDASPTRLESEAGEESGDGRQSSPRYSERSPSPYERKRGRAPRQYRARSPSSDSSSSDSSAESSSGSRSRSPPRKRYRSRHSGSSSSSLSPPRPRRYSYSSSRSGSWSRSRSRSRSRSTSPQACRPRWNSHRSPPHRTSCRYDTRDCSEDGKRRKEKAIEERRVVYVGRIRGGMTRKELKERFSLYGEIEECTLHFRDHGDNYGFVTYYDTKDAFAAIENGSKLRQPNELPFDLCFGGRRQFCKTSYADLDSNREYEPMPTKGKFDALDFDTLLKQAQKTLKR